MKTDEGSWAQVDQKQRRRGLASFGGQWQNDELGRMGEESENLAIEGTRSGGDHRRGHHHRDFTPFLSSRRESTAYTLNGD